jgi:hypothetical protein
MIEIPLTRGQVALIDDEDFELVNQYKWYAIKNKGGSWSAATNIRVLGKRKSLKMQYLIIKPLPGRKIYFINKNPLDLKKVNLRNGETKICTKCKEEKLRCEFLEGKGPCKICCDALSRERHYKNRDANNAHRRYWHSIHKEKHQDNMLKRNYGISLIEYNLLLEKQNNVCAICGKKETEKHTNGNVKNLSVDHDHYTGQIRGLLCSKCNHAIGFLGDSPGFLFIACMYLINAHKDYEKLFGNLEKENE